MLSKNLLIYKHIIFTMTNQNVLKNDLPITKFDDDKLDRQKFALQMRRIIKNYKKKDCLTLGIMGSWGSGKTSLINMVFDQNKDNILTEKDFKVMRFNPWNFSKQQDLYYQFFEQLKELLISNENDEGKRNHAKNIINEYWEKIRYNGTVSLSCSGISYSKPLGEKTLEVKKKEINKTLRYLGYKLIIIIDDLDRLTDDEVQQIFILVKALADFPNIIYILPFDRNIILNSMGDMQKDYGEEFLDKIIQLHIDIPKIPKSKVRNLFKKELEVLLKNEKIDLSSENRSFWSTLLFLTNIREVNRYINSLTFYLPLMKDEVNILDYTLLTGFQLFENKIYHEIKENKTFFTKSLMKKPDREKLPTYQEHFKNILDKKETLTEELLIEILKVLFPQLENFDRNWDMANQVSEWDSKLRVCSYKMFDRYFELTIGENEMSNVAFEMIIQSDNYEFIKQEVLNNDNDGKSENFLEKLKTNVQKIDSKNIKLFLRLLFDIGDNLNVDTGDFIFSKNTLLLQNIGALSKQLNNQELYESMDYAIKNAEDCLYLLVDELSIHDKINQRYRFKNQKSNGKKELTNDQLDKLENEACIKIKQWVDNGKIFEVYRAIEVIYNWYYWDNEEYGRFIEKTLKNDTELIKLIIIFIKEISNENDTVTCEFNFSIMEEICPIDKIYNRIHSIISKIEDIDYKIVCENFIEKYNQKYN